jgi:hypothetical protein
LQRLGRRRIPFQIRASAALNQVPFDGAVRRWRREIGPHRRPAGLFSDDGQLAQKTGQRRQRPVPQEICLQAISPKRSAHKESRLRHPPLPEQPAADWPIGPTSSKNKTLKSELPDRVHERRPGMRVLIRRSAIRPPRMTGIT